MTAAAAAQQPALAPVPAEQLTYADLAGLAEPRRGRRSGARDAIRRRSSPSARPASLRATPGSISRRGPRRCSRRRRRSANSLNYLVDVPLDAKGKPPKLKKQTFLVFARHASRAARARCSWSSPTPSCRPTTRSTPGVRAVIAELAAPDAPPRITGVRDAMSVAGNLAGESETQLFLDTADRRAGLAHRGAAARAWPRPGASRGPRSSTRPPARPNAARSPGTASPAHCRASCPATPTCSATAHRATQARADYALVLDQLGPCDAQPPPGVNAP